MARSRSTPARRGPVRGSRRRSRWESRPGRLALTGWLLVTVALGVTMVAQSGGGPVATPADTALPSRPAAGPDPGDGAPDEEEGPEVPEDVPADPEDVPDESKAPEPRRSAPAPEAPVDDAPGNVPDETPADRPEDEPAPVDPSGDDRYGTDPGVPSEEVLPDEKAPVLSTEEENTDAVPFTGDEVAAPDERDRYSDHRYGGATPVDVDSSPTTMAAPQRHGRPSHRTDSSPSPMLSGDDGGDCPAAGGAPTTRTRDHHGVGDPGDRYRSAPAAAQPGYLVEHAGPGGDRVVHVPSGVYQQSDSHSAGSVTYVGP